MGSEQWEYAAPPPEIAPSSDAGEPLARRSSKPTRHSSFRRCDSPSRSLPPLAAIAAVRADDGRSAVIGYSRKKETTCRKQSRSRAAAEKTSQRLLHPLQ